MPLSGLRFSSLRFFCYWEIILIVTCFIWVVFIHVLFQGIPEIAFVAEKELKPQINKQTRTVTNQVTNAKDNNRLQYTWVLLFLLQPENRFFEIWKAGTFRFFQISTMTFFCDVKFIWIAGVPVLCLFIPTNDIDFLKIV